MATLTRVVDTPGGGGTSELYAALPRSPKIATWDLAFDSSYPDGGESIAEVFADFQEVLSVHAEPKGAYIFEVDSSNQKLVVFEAISGTSEVQTITLTDGPTGGTFTVTYAGQTTTDLAYDISGDDLETALDALSNIADGDVEVVRSGSGTAAAPYVHTLTFGGALAGENVAAVTGTGTALTAGTITIGTTTAGTGVKERQTLTLTAGDADDTFTLTFNAHASDPITVPPGGYVNVTKAQIAAALATISDFDGLDIISVADGTVYDILVGGTGGVYTIDFSGTLTGDVGDITVTDKVGAADGSVAETTKGVTGVSEVQTVTLTDGPTGGTFTITYAGQTTSALAYNASGATVTSALEALSNINAGEVVSVRTGSGTQADPYVHTLTWRADSGNVASPTATGTALTGSTITVGTTTSGSEVQDLGSLASLSTRLVAVGF